MIPRPQPVRALRRPQPVRALRRPQPVRALRRPRPMGALLLLGSVLLLVGVGGVGQARAAAYRYWSFWERDGSAWAYATQGPSTARPLDGDVQGFRFAVGRDSADAARPRGAADFATVCGDTAARNGHKRVALVIDFGTAVDAPAGETPPAARTACARVPDDATTADALASVAKPLRYDTNALLCAIADYPGKGCGEAVDADSETAASSPTSDDEDGPSVGLFAGAAAVAVLGAAALWQTRRRRRHRDHDHHTRHDDHDDHDDHDRA